ncbi:MAG: guanylate kinase [Lachnospiraceae bacterium]|nr:guanylate kinase [Lachnospiraceae bacterium]
MCSERNLQTGSRRGKLIIISGFSGVGKGTLMKELQATYPGQYALSVSVTTRSPRAGETDGISYHFKTQEEFDRLIKEDYFVEYARYTGKSYGTPKPFVEENLAAGRNVILEIELQGALIVREKYPDAKLVFITTKDAKTLVQRLTGRGTETEEVIRKRLARAVEEANGVEQYHHIIVNDELSAAVKELHEVIQTENGSRISEAELALITDIQSDLKERLSI